MFKSSQKFIYIIILILFIINCLFISSCCQYEIKGTIRVTNEAGKAISGVKILQNTSIISHPNILPFLDSDEDQKNIQLHRNQSNENGEVCYSTQLFRPSQSYFIFYKEGYFPTLVWLDSINERESVILVNRNSNRLKVGDMMRSQISLLTWGWDAPDRVARLEERYGEDFSKYFDREQLFQVYNEIDTMKNAVRFMYVVPYFSE